MRFCLGFWGVMPQEQELQQRYEQVNRANQELRRQVPRCDSGAALVGRILAELGWIGPKQIVEMSAGLSEAAGVAS